MDDIRLAPIPSDWYPTITQAMRDEWQQQIFRAFGVPADVLGMKVILDDTLSPNVIEVRSGQDVVRIVNLKT